MRRIQLILPWLVGFGAAVAAAQSPQPAAPAVPALAGTSAEDVLARVLSFDRNTDGRVAREELPERMKNLVTRGDADGNGALDASEIRTLSRTPVPTGGRGFAVPTLYQLPAESWFPERSHIEGALTDLKLGTDVHRSAIAVVDAHQQHLKGAALAAAGHLLRELENVLTAEQLADFKTALERPESRGTLRFRLPAGGATVPGGTVSNALLVFEREVFAERRGSQSLGSDLARRLIRYGLPAEQARVAVTALEGYTANLSDLGRVERAALVEQMREILTDEERDNFRAALDRRSAVPFGVMGGVVSGMRERGDAVINIAPPVAAPPAP